MIGVRGLNPKCFATVARYWPRKPSIGFRYRGNGTIREAPGLVRDDEIRVKLHLDAKPVTVLAGTKRAVEGEHPRLEFLECEPADRACHEGRVQWILSPLHQRRARALRIF